MATPGERIREIREKRGMTQERMAIDAKLSKSFISDVENDKTNISSEGILRIANCLGASVDYLLQGVTRCNTEEEQVTIPKELSQAAEELDLSYNGTLELLNAHRSIIARRSNKTVKEFQVEDWKKLHEAIKEVYK